MLNLNNKWNRAESIQIRSFAMGQDVVFLVTGGTAHIGATATAYISNDRVVCADILSLPGHREGELAAELAMMASRRLGRTVAVLAGIHIEKPSKQDIEHIIVEVKRNMEQVLDQWMDCAEV